MELIRTLLGILAMVACATLFFALPILLWKKTSAGAKSGALLAFGVVLMLACWFYHTLAGVIIGAVITMMAFTLLTTKKRV